MKRTILILGRSFHPDGKETATDIYNGLKPYFTDDYALELAYHKDILFDISNDVITVKNMRTNRSLEVYDAVLMTNWFSHASIRKDIAYSLALFFEAKGIPCFNSEALHSRSTSKLSQMMIAALHGITIPRTIFSLSYRVLQNALQNQKVLSVPFVLKDAQASRGNGNYLIKHMPELDEHRKEHTETHPFLAQSFISSEQADYRFFVTAGKVGLIIRRSGSPASHLYNTSTGATTEAMAPDEFSDDIRALVERISALVRREVTGIDIIFTKDTRAPVFLEANPIPQIATGSNVALKLENLAAALMQAANERKKK